MSNNEKKQYGGTVRQHWVAPITARKKLSYRQCDSIKNYAAKNTYKTVGRTARLKEHNSCP